MECGTKFLHGVLAKFCLTQSLLAFAFTEDARTKIVRTMPTAEPMHPYIVFASCINFKTASGVTCFFLFLIIHCELARLECINVPDTLLE